MSNLIQPGDGRVVAQSGPSMTMKNSMEAPFLSQYLNFLCSGDSYGVAIQNIKEIIEPGGMATVPMMPPCVRGVINLRGAVVPVLDLAARFGREPTSISKRTCIVIFEMDGEERSVLGMLVDSVSAVVEILSTDIEPAPTFGARIRQDFIFGIGKVGGKFVTLLDSERVLSIEEITELARSGLPTLTQMA